MIVKASAELTGNSSIRDDEQDDVVLAVVHRLGQGPDVVNDRGVASWVGQRH